MRHTNSFVGKMAFVKLETASVSLVDIAATCCHVGALCRTGLSSLWLQTIYFYMKKELMRRKNGFVQKRVVRHQTQRALSYSGLDLAVCLCRTIRKVRTCVYGCVEAKELLWFKDIDGMQICNSNLQTQRKSVMHLD